MPCYPASLRINLALRPLNRLDRRPRRRRNYRRTHVHEGQPCEHVQQGRQLAGHSKRSELSLLRAAFQELGGRPGTSVEAKGRLMTAPSLVGISSVQQGSRVGAATVKLTWAAIY